MSQLPRESIPASIADPGSAAFQMKGDQNNPAGRFQFRGIHGMDGVRHGPIVLYYFCVLDYAFLIIFQINCATSVSTDRKSDQHHDHFAGDDLQRHAFLKGF